MKVFIFGAGASLGSQNEKYAKGSQHRAPLVDELFDIAYKDYAVDILSPDDLTDSNIALKENQTIEQWLTTRWENIKNKDEKTKHAELAFFGRVTIYIWKLMLSISETYNSQNAYNVLLNKIRKKEEKFGLISFNYDTLLEKAVFEQYGYTFEETLIDYETVELVKPHGSINWLFRGDSTGKTLLPNVARDVPLRMKVAARNMFAQKQTMDRINIFSPNNRLIKLSTIDLLHRSFDVFPLYPLVLIPLITKLHKEIEKFQERIIHKGIELLSKADEIYLIGYRAEDELIEEMFKAIKKETIIHSVGLETSEEILDKVIKLNPTKLKKGNVYKKGFRDFVVNY